MPDIVIWSHSTLKYYMNCQNTHSHDFDFLINFEVSRKESISDAKLHIKVATFLHDPECIFSNINVIKICAFLHIFFTLLKKPI